MVQGLVQGVDCYIGRVVGNRHHPAEQRRPSSEIGLVDRKRPARGVVVKSRGEQIEQQTILHRRGVDGIKVLAISQLHVTRPLHPGIGPDMVALTSPAQNVGRFQINRLPGRAAMHPAQPADGREFVHRKIPVVRHAHQRVLERKIRSAGADIGQFGHLGNYAPRLVTIVYLAQVGQ